VGCKCADAAGIIHNAGNSIQILLRQKRAIFREQSVIIEFSPWQNIGGEGPESEMLPGLPAVL
jgi:hypothetical protein